MTKTGKGLALYTQGLFSWLSGENSASLRQKEGVRVGEGPTHASLRVPDVAGMAELLGRLAELRARG